MKDYYKILNLKKDASNAQIKKRVLQLGKQLHPDSKQAEILDKSETKTIKTLKGLHIPTMDEVHRIKKYLRKTKP